MGTPNGLTPQEMGMVLGDLLVAGSDTTATVLAVSILLLYCSSQFLTPDQATTYLLLQNATKFHLLKNEIRSTFKDETEITLTAINNLPYLSAVINESMRLFPSAPETTRRISNGDVICGEFVPAGVRSLLDYSAFLVQVELMYNRFQ